MIKCYFVDVKSISSTIPKSKFKKAEIDRLADAILAADGLLRPLILQQTGVEKYTVVEGHREYYAAVRAKEKDIKKAEMVNAFVIDANSHKSAIDQLDLLTRSQPPTQIAEPTPDPQIFTDLLAESIDRLLPTITAAISTQIQPLVAQLTNQQQILDTIKLELVNKSTGKIAEVPKIKEITQPVADVDSSDRKPDLPATKPAKVAKTTRNSKKPKPEAIPFSPIAVVVVVEPAKQPVTTAASIPKAKPGETKPTAAIGSIESDKSTTALNLINTLSQDDLILRMQRSAVLPAIIKLVPTIVAKRTSQPEQRFDNWEDLINLKISGLTSTKAQDIIKKLK